MKNLSNKGWQYVGLTMLLSVLPYYFIITQYGIDSNWTLALMWMPAVAAIIMRLLSGEGLFKGLKWNPLKAWKFILMAAFLPFTIEIVSLVFTLGLHGAELKEGFLQLKDGHISVNGTALLFGASLQPWYIFIPNYLLSYFTGVLFYSLLFAFGEEYGWRGYLQKQWAPVNSRVSGFIAIGIIWGFWHLPGVLLGHNFPDYKLIGGLLLMPLICVGFSIVFGTAFNKNYVIWVPAVFHGAVNISSEITNTALVEESIHNPLYDSIWIGLWVLTGVFFYLRYIREDKVKITKEMEQQSLGEWLGKVP